jgi:putative colanic acid biosynthesis glycosyltransferase
MIKLLQICVEGNVGSTGTIAESIGEMAIEKGWESYIAHGRWPRPSKSQTFRIESDLGVMLHGLETRLFDRHGLGSRHATKSLINKIKKIDPDVIHLHHIHGYYINIEILFDYLSSANKPVIWTQHDCWSFTGHCAFFDFVGCEKWKTECFKCPQKRAYPKSLFLDRSKENYSLKKKLFTSVPGMVIVSVSKWLDNLVSESFFKRSKHIVIYNGVDVNIFKPQEVNETIRSKYNLIGKHIMLGVASTWEPRKGLKDYISLSKLLGEDEIIILIGLSQKQINDLPENIIGLSRTENKQELVDLYNISDVYINLSVEETFGLTTAEALACGTPVIVYNSTACPELVDTNTGMVIAKNDIYSVYNAVSKILENGKSSYSDKCRQRVIDNFDEKKKYTKYLETYESLIKEFQTNII